MMVLGLGILFGPLFVARSSAQPLLIGHWDFDADARDVSGNGNDGVFVTEAVAAGGGASPVVPGFPGPGSVVPGFPGPGSVVPGFPGSTWEVSEPLVVNKELVCDGKSGVIIPSLRPFRATSPFQVSAFIYVDAFDKPGQAIVTKGAAWAVRRDDNKNVVQFTCSGLYGGDAPWTGIVSVSGTKPIPYREWTLVAGTYDGQKLSLYVNGVLEASTKVTGGTIDRNTAAVMIGGDAAQPGLGFRGWIDDVRIFNGAAMPVNLTPFVDAGPDQIIRLARLPSKPIPIQLTGQVVDDGRPAGTTPAIHWSLVNGVGSVSILNPSSLITTASVSQPGIYRLELTADDGQYARSDQVQIEVRLDAQQRSWLWGEQLIRQYTPAAWQADQVSWMRDVSPRNKIDDLIDASNEPTFSVIVNFKDAVTDADVIWLGGVGAQSQVQMRLKYISSVAVTGYTKQDLLQIAANPAVAFIELQVGFGGALDRTVPMIGITPDFVSRYGCDGAGTNIVIMDTGVDNVCHKTFGPALARGLDAVNGTFDTVTHTFTCKDGDPDDTIKHGTHVASIALGREWTGVDDANNTHTCRGVAPAAELIDVKIPLSPPNDSKSRPEEYADWNRTTAALQAVYDHRSTWSVNVINMSIAQRDPTPGKWDNPIPSDGTDAFSQLVDLGESLGIVVVAAAGNFGASSAKHQLAAPAAATKAIAVAWGQPDRRSGSTVPDWVSDGSARGPRAADGDLDKMDTLKPEVTAPGAAVEGTLNAAAYSEDPKASGPATGIYPDGGTSQAAPHVSGLAALILQKYPGINAAAVKDLLIATAKFPKKPITPTTPSAPEVDPTWNKAWGWGLVDANEALLSNKRADITFPHDPPQQSWLSPDVNVIPFPFEEGQDVTISATIRNKGPAAAEEVRVHFGVHALSATPPAYGDIGTAVVEKLEPGEDRTVTVHWKPKNANHVCFQAEIGYGFDPNYANNRARRSLVWADASSVVHIPVRNILTEEAARIELVGSWEDSKTDWGFQLAPSSVTLGANDPPADIQVKFIPGTGSQQMLHLAAVWHSLSIPEQTPIELGGTSLSGLKR